MGLVLRFCELAFVSDFRCFEGLDPSNYIAFLRIKRLLTLLVVRRDSRRRIGQGDSMSGGPAISFFMCLLWLRPWSIFVVFGVHMDGIIGIG